MMIVPKPTFTPAAEYEFVHKIEKPHEKVDEELESRFDKAKTDEERREILKAHKRIGNILVRCKDNEIEEREIRY